MNLIDKQWIINGSDIFHICRGDETGQGNKKVSLNGFWPIDEENKCKVCKTEVPKHALIYLDKIK